MSIISYAQNFEDVMLWRALGHVSGGLYVDIGAQHPVVDSVSMAFHEAGWHGVHVEPVPAYAQLLRQARPNDTVLQVALGATDGTLELHVIDDSGLSTAVDAYADQHRNDSGMPARSVQVPMLTMRSALAHLAGRTVHWLKIDVEGFEEQVLRGWDSSTLRPWVLVVEATRPGSPEADFAGWDPLVTAAGYLFVYFDGLNRFYVAAEHAELAAAFTAPPNVFDGAQLSGLASAPWCHRLLTEAAENARRAEEHALWLRNEWNAASAHGQGAEQALARQREAYEGLESALARQREAYEGLESALARQCEACAALERVVAIEQARDAAATEDWLAAQARAAAAEQALAAERLRTDAAERELALIDDARHDSLALVELLRQLRDEQAAQMATLSEQQASTEAALEAKIADLQHWSHHWYTIAEQREQTRLALLRSSSWRLSAPLRGAASLARRSARLARRVPPALRRRTLALARRAVRWAVRAVLANGRLSQLARGVLGSHPALKARLRHATVSADADERSRINGADGALHPAQLSERAGRLYLGLRKAAPTKDH
ncbi:FkbM family methyltransferase [Massilia sp. DWR3-1-1]|uniref:FkbM family methyltransferase n=1 Tax=Massilia sp. DWR3-1-1 TaxID=2804559 RepID=UPI003CF74CC7